ncbi:MAG: DUF2017 family protein [Actinomycetaceae bacterium]|nr:DUF2017 family protein [Actinomycetaceae bacterium]
MIAAFTLRKGVYKALADTAERHAMRQCAAQLLDIFGVSPEEARDIRDVDMHENNKVEMFTASEYDVLSAYENELKEEHLDVAFDDFNIRHREYVFSGDENLKELLLPSVYQDNEESKKYRQMYDADIVHLKVANMSVFYESLSDRNVILRPSDVPMWLMAVADMRKMLAYSLGVRDEETAQELDERLVSFVREHVHNVNNFGENSAPEEDGDEENFIFMLVYYMLGWWQETLLEVVR